ncbi:MAG: hypothetical protein ACTSRP_25775 [Candidatus Helarchaeota archaeon]
MDGIVEMLITDDFSVYKTVLSGLENYLVHIRHIHKLFYKQMVIDKIEIKDKNKR